MKPFFVFSGQGAQAPGMGRDLYENSSEAKAVFDEADAVLNFKLSEVCFAGPADLLTSTTYCQTAIYTMSCAALAAFKARFPEVEPIACAGLSLGEYGALFAGGAFSFADGLKLLNERAKLMDECCKKTDGTMASVLGGDIEIIREVCAEVDMDVANYNSPGQIVISGERAKVEKAVALLKEKGMRKVIPLNVAGAFHSRLMSDAGVKLANVLAAVPMTMPEVPVYHNFTAKTADSVDAIKSNLASQVAGSVQWENCVRNMVEIGADTMFEFGPGNVLTGLLRRTLPEIKSFNINSFESLNNYGSQK